MIKNEGPLARQLGKGLIQPRWLARVAAAMIVAAALVAIFCQAAAAQEVDGYTNWNPSYGAYHNTTFWVTGEVKTTPGSFKVVATLQQKWFFWWRQNEVEVFYSRPAATYWYYDNIHSTFVPKGSGSFRITQELYLRYSGAWVLLKTNASQLYWRP